MKHILILFLIGFATLSCRKDKVPPAVESNYYQSNGNLLILKIEGDLESVYEYNLSSTVLTNDSLPLYTQSQSDGLYDYYYQKISPNPDTLLWYSVNNSSFETSQIDENELKQTNYPLPYDSTQFQLIGDNSDIDYSVFWSKISKLDIVRLYRNSNPTSKIGITRITLYELDEELGINLPKETHLIYLVK